MWLRLYDKATEEEAIYIAFSSSVAITPYDEVWVSTNRSDLKLLSAVRN